MVKQFLAAILIVTVAMVAAEPPVRGYQARGWRPQGLQFKLPEPAASYGPPTEQPEITTTEQPITTEEPTTTEQPRKSEKLTENKDALYVLLPQQNYYYTESTAKLLQPQQQQQIPLQAVPAFAKLQEQPQQVAPIAQLQLVATSSAYKSPVFLQLYQPL